VRAPVDGIEDNPRSVGDLVDQPDASARLSG
jgi:hypothetical protein